MANREDFLKFDDMIVGDGKSFILLDEGDYDFTVTNIMRGSVKNGANQGANMVTVTCRVTTEGGQQDIKTNFVLTKASLWKIAEIHRCLGLKKHGEDVKMQWEKFEGLKGKCHVVQVDGTKVGVKFNDINKFYDSEEKEPAKKGGLSLKV